MIKVIKEKKRKKIVTCPHCNCLLSYEEEDIDNSTQAIVCTNCNHEIEVEKWDVTINL